MIKLCTWFIVDEGTSWENLSDPQKEAILGVKGEYPKTVRMAGTLPRNGKVILDTLMDPTFRPEIMDQLGFNWEILGQWRYDFDTEELETIVPLDEQRYLDFLPEVKQYDEDGAVISSSPPVLKQTHKWQGMPDLI
jgi:hypothetical protein